MVATIASSKRMMDASAHAVASVPLAEWEKVGKLYPATVPGAPGLWALRGVDLAIAPGEVLGVVGPNRAGKTTLVKLLLTLCRPTEGRVRRFGRPGSDRGTLAKVGYVPDDPAFPSEMTARDVLLYYGALTTSQVASPRQHATALLERVGLADRAAEPIGRFSKGMVQRLALAQALWNSPGLLVLDEPAEGLDLAGRNLLRAIVTDRKAGGGSTLLISHAPGEVERLCDRLAVLVAGRKVFDGSPRSLTGEPGTPGARSLESALGLLYEGANA